MPPNPPRRTRFRATADGRRGLCATPAKWQRQPRAEHTQRQGGRRFCRKGSCVGSIVPTRPAACRLRPPQDLRLRGSAPDESRPFGSRSLGAPLDLRGVGSRSQGVVGPDGLTAVRHREGGHGHKSPLVCPWWSCPVLGAGLMSPERVSSHRAEGGVPRRLTAVPGDVFALARPGDPNTVNSFSHTGIHPPCCDCRVWHCRQQVPRRRSQQVGVESLSPRDLDHRSVGRRSPRRLAEIDLVMHRNGQAAISIDFPEDPTCVPEGGPCGGCCVGTACDAATGLCAACIGVGDACDPTQLCCDGHACATGICGEPPACVANGQPCDGTQPCCSSGVECVGGTCGSCAAPGTTCDEGQPCCDGVDCTDGVCGGCFMPATACDGSKPCCGGVDCTDGACGGCIDDGAACNAGHVCCSGAACRSGTCGGPDARPRERRAVASFSAAPVQCAAAVRACLE